MKKIIYIFMFLMMFSFTSAFNFDDGTLESYFDLEETSGSVIDYTGAITTAYNNGSTRGVTGIFQNAFEFDAPSTEYVNLTSNPLFNIAGGDFSINFWMNPSNIQTSQRIMGLGQDISGTVDSYIEFVIDASNNTIAITHESGVFTLNPIIGSTPSGSWYMISLVRDGTTLRTYLDGVSTSNTSMVGSFTSLLNNNATIGSATALNQFYDGKLDEIGFWNRSIPVNEVLELYNNGDSFTPNSLIQLINPENNVNKLVGETINFTSISNDNGADWVNSSLWIDGVINETISITGLTNTTSFFKSFSPNGSYSWFVQSCNNASACFNSSIRTINIDYYLSGDVAFTTPALVGDTIPFSFPFNVSSGITVSSANLIYNGTSYSVSINNLGSGQYNLTRDLIIPNPSGNIPFYFNVVLSNAVTFNSSSNNLTVNAIGVDDCSVYTNVLYNFTTYDEKNKAFLNGASSSVNHSLTIELFNSDKSTSLVTYSKEYTNTNPAVVCLQNSLSTSSDFVIDLQMQYTADGYAKEYYNIFGDSLNINDMGTVIPLYLLDNSSSQEFEILYRDSSFSPVTDAVIQIQRKYISEGLFRTVEQPKTDYQGKTLAHLELDDVIYNFVVLVDGVITASFNNVIAVCQNPSFNDCEISLTESESFVEVTDFDTLNEFTFTGPSFDENTRTVSATFSITSGSTSTVVLNVTLFDALGDTFVCDSSLLSSSGSLECVVPSSFGNATIIASLYQDGNKKALGTFTIGQNPSDIHGNNIIWVGLIIFFSFLGLGISGNPVITGAFMILTAVVLIVFNVFANTGFIGAGATILWFIVAIIILMIKGARRI